MYRLEFQRCTKENEKVVFRSSTVSSPETYAMVFGKNVVNLFDILLRDAFQHEPTIT